MKSSKKSEQSSTKRLNKETASFPERFFENTLASGRLSHAYLMLGADMPAIMAFCRRLAARLFVVLDIPPEGVAVAEVVR